MYSLPKILGAPSQADISEKTATVQGSGIDTTEQTEGDHEMKTVSVSGKEEEEAAATATAATAVLPRHLDSMSLLF